MAHSFTLRRGTLLDRLARCMTVSVFTTLLSLSVLVGLTAGFGVTAWVANVVATAVGTVPSYELNRRWVWGRREQSSLSREVLPFWVLSFSGLVLSTVSVALADRWARHAALTGFARSAALVLANVGAFGVLWVAQFLLLDRVLFAPRKTVAS
jgi:putative flippase GtrA